MDKLRFTTPKKKRRSHWVVLQGNRRISRHLSLHKALERASEVKGARIVESV